MFYRYQASEPSLRRLRLFHRVHHVPNTLFNSVSSSEFWVLAHAICILLGLCIQSLLHAPSDLK